MGTNTGIGIGIGIPFKNFSSGGRQPLPPDLKASLKGVWIAYGKSNDDADRSIVKNLVDASNPFIISNAAFKLNSGYGLYGMDFLDWKSNSGMNFTSTKLTSTKPNLSGGWLTFRSVSGLIPETKVKVSGAPRNFVFIGNNNGADDNFSVTINNGVYTIPEFTLSSASGFYINNNSGDWSNLVIEQIPSFEGAFVTDGINDLITSTKTVQEMGITDEITVVSMIHKISSDNNWSNLIGELKGDHTFVANRGINTDKTGIYGYTYNYNKNAIVINNILGDKNDYIVRTSTSLGLDNKYYVTGFTSAGIIQNISQIAWYWTFIANRVLTTDEINQVIAYFNLDRTLKPDILCNTIKQGITNENHAEFGDKLIDFSGNGRDIQLNNIAWKGDSGIGKYVEDFTTWSGATGVLQTFSKIEVTDGFKHNWVINRKSGESAINSFKVLIKGIPENGYIQYRYFESEDATKKSSIDIYEDGEYSLPNSTLNNLNDLVGFQLFAKIPPLDSQSFIGLTITQIPSHAGALCLDGVIDFGKVTGIPVYKDYTIIADYERFYLEPITGGRASILSKSSKVGDGSFIFNLEDQNGGKVCYTLGEANGNISDDITRIIRYQSKYYNTKALSIGTAKDNDFMVLGKVREVDNRYFYGAIYSLMSFPYSMSKFLIERQLKKHKLGTLYPNMVEFRPIIPEDENITRIDYFVVNSGKWTVIKPGDYVDVGARIVINVYTKFPYKVEKVSSLAFTGMSVGSSTKLNIFDVKGYIKDKTPQKIKFTLAVNEDIVQWNPTITSNLLDSFTVSSWYLNDWDNTLTEGTWIKKTDKVFFKATFKTELYGLETATFGGTECVVSKADNWSDSKNIWDIRMLGTVGDLSQVFNLDVYELIRFEDIVQPYPLFFEFTDENGNLISWGGKAKVGSTITRIKGVAYANLLEGLFTITNQRLNGVLLSSFQHVVEKSMVFTCTATWTFDNNEPKCILSPSRLRIPNSSYKLLGYIPDISGHGNHGIIHNSAYAEGSGVNEDGSYQFDGVDDFVTIPTVTGGKQVLMKVNWGSLNHVLYDQRNNAEAPFCIVAASGTIAYNQRNVGGNTYIDGILNNHILVDDLQAITHNIVLNNDYNVANSNSFIGTNYTKSIYAKMSLYDFMLFDNISTDDKIKELNEYVGIEGNTE